MNRVGMMTTLLLSREGLRDNDVPQKEIHNLFPLSQVESSAASTSAIHRKAKLTQLFHRQGPRAEGVCEADLDAVFPVSTAVSPECLFTSPSRSETPVVQRKDPVPEMAPSEETKTTSTKVKETKKKE